MGSLAFQFDSWLGTEVHVEMLESTAHRPIAAPSFPCKRHD